MALAVEARAIAQALREAAVVDAHVERDEGTGIEGHDTSAGRHRIGHGALAAPLAAQQTRELLGPDPDEGRGLVLQDQRSRPVRPYRRLHDNGRPALEPSSVRFARATNSPPAGGPCQGQRHPGGLDHHLGQVVVAARRLGGHCGWRGLRP